MKLSVVTVTLAAPSLTVDVADVIVLALAVAVVAVVAMVVVAAVAAVAILTAAHNTVADEVVVAVVACEICAKGESPHQTHQAPAEPPSATMATKAAAVALGSTHTVMFELFEPRANYITDNTDALYCRDASDRCIRESTDCHICNTARLPGTLLTFALPLLL